MKASFLSRLSRWGFWFSVLLETTCYSPRLLAQAIAPAADGTGTQVSAVGARIDISGGSLSADGTNLFHSFQAFNLDENRIANFLSHPNISNILGRVTGGDPSVINGLIQVSGGNSNLYLMNPAGIIFGAGSSLNVPADFTATTATGIGFNNGGWFNAFGDNNYFALNGAPAQFAFDLSSSGSIVNSGNLSVAAGKNLTLMGGTVVNTGTLTANSGNLLMASIPGTHSVSISQPGNLLSLEIQPPRDLNGQILPFNALQLPQLLTHSAVKNANIGLTLDADNQVRLASSGTIIPPGDGTTIVAGNLNTSGDYGGNIDVLGEKVALIGATLNAAATEGSGGNLRIGGDYQGNGNIPNAARTYVSQDSVLNANAGSNGNGGKIINWSDEVTGFYGFATARGGINSGNGGFIEISGKENLVFQGNADVGADNGLLGTILFDPRDINIVAGVGTGDIQIGDNQILFGDADAFTDFEIGATTLQGLAGTIILQASRDINLNTSLTLGSAIGIRLNAGNNFNGAGQTIALPNSPLSDRFIEITAANNLTVGNLNTASNNASGNSNGGTIRLTATNGSIIAGTLNSSAITSPASIGIASIGGQIEINAGSSVTTANIDSSGSASTSFGGATGRGGAITINAGSTLNVGDVNSTASATAPGAVSAIGGAIALTSGSTINAGEIASFATGSNISVGVADGTGGNVRLQSGTTPGSDIQWTSITATGTGQNTGTAQGGTVEILAVGRVRGTGAGTTIDTRGLGAATQTPGAVTIQHDGGFNNAPFVIGDASSNGLTGAINTLAAGSFDVKPTGGSDTPQPNITIISINTPPAITPFANPVALLQPGQSYNIAFADIQKQVTDVNLDDFINNSIVISNIANSGILTLIRGGNSIVLTSGALQKLQVGDVLQFTADANVIGSINLFDIVADDRVSFSNRQPLQIQVNLAQNPDIPYNPDFPNSPRFPLETCPPFCGGNDILKQPTPADSSSAIDDVEGRLTGEFISYGGMTDINLRSLDRVREILREIEDNTGEKPAILYVSFIPLDANRPNPDTDELELMVVTAKGVPYRRPIRGVTRAQMMPVADRFRGTVTNVSRQNSFLAPSKQLYDWIIAPVRDELKRREITNISFIFESGLRSLPVAALNDGEKFIIEQYSVGLMPSLSLVDTRYRDIKKLAVLGMGSDTFLNLPPLPAVPLELQIITQNLWPGQALFDRDFTPEKLDEARGTTPYGIVHLATHAEFKSGKPENSFIQFWGNSRLSLDRIRQLKLIDPPVELLVLSACRTALGDREAELGFAGLAARAGVKSTLGSLWSVSDEGTLGLMVGFYEQLKTASIKAEALRQVQLAMLQGKVRLQDGQLVMPQGSFPLTPELQALGDRTLTHPYYWSAFTLVGNPW